MKPIIVLNPDPIRRIPEIEIDDPLSELWKQFVETELKDLKELFANTVLKLQTNPALVSDSGNPILSEEEVKVFNSNLANEVKKQLKNLFPLLKENQEFNANSQSLIGDIVRRTVGTIDNILTIEDYCLTIFSNFFYAANGQFSLQTLQTSEQIFNENISGLSYEDCMGGNSSFSEDISRKRRTSHLSLFEGIKDSVIISLFDDFCKRGNQVHVNSLVNLLFGDFEAKRRDETISAATIHTSIPQLHDIIRKLVFSRFDLTCEYLAREYEKMFLSSDGDLSSQNNDLLQQLCNGENAIDHEKIDSARIEKEKANIVRSEIAEKLKKLPHQVIVDETELELIDSLCLCAAYTVKNIKIPVWLQRKIWYQKNQIEIWSTVKQKDLDQGELKKFISEYAKQLDEKYQINFDVLRDLQFHDIPRHSGNPAEYLRQCLACGEEFRYVYEYEKPFIVEHSSNFDLSGILFHPDQQQLLTVFFRSLVRAHGRSELIAGRVIGNHLKNFYQDGDYNLLNFNGFLLNSILHQKSAEMHIYDWTANQIELSWQSVINYLNSQDGSDGELVANLTFIDVIKQHLLIMLDQECQSEDYPEARNVFQVITFNSNNPLALAQAVKKIIYPHNNDLQLIHLYYSSLSENMEFIAGNFANKNDKVIDDFVFDLVSDKTYENIVVSDRMLSQNSRNRMIDGIESCKRYIVKHLADCGNEVALRYSLMLQSPAASAGDVTATRMLPLRSHSVESSE